MGQAEKGWCQHHTFNSRRLPRNMVGMFPLLVQLVPDVHRARGNMVTSLVLSGRGIRGSHNVVTEIVRAIYDYRAQGSDEIDVQEGELVELTGGQSGGQNYADGWWEGRHERQVSNTRYLMNMCHRSRPQRKEGYLPQQLCMSSFLVHVGCTLTPNV